MRILGTLCAAIVGTVAFASLPGCQTEQGGEISNRTYQFSHDASDRSIPDYNPYSLPYNSDAIRTDSAPN